MTAINLNGLCAGSRSLQGYRNCGAPYSCRGSAQFVSRKIWNTLVAVNLWSTVLHENLIFSELFGKFYAHCGTVLVITIFTGALSLFLVLTQTHPAKNLLCYFFRFVLMLSFRTNSSRFVLILFLNTASLKFALILLSHSCLALPSGKIFKQTSLAYNNWVFFIHQRKYVSGRLLS